MKGEPEKCSVYFQFSYLSDLTEIILVFMVVDLVYLYVASTYAGVSVT